MRSEKDYDITLIALLKSVIESGAPKEQWEEMVKFGFNLHNKLLARIMESTKNG